MTQINPKNKPNSIPSKDSPVLTPEQKEEIKEKIVLMNRFGDDEPYIIWKIRGSYPWMTKEQAADIITECIVRKPRPQPRNR